MDLPARKDDYDTPQGVVGNSYARGSGGSVGGSWIADTGRAGLGVVRYQSQLRNSREKNRGSTWTQTKLLLRTQMSLSAGALNSVTLDGGWADYEHQRARCRWRPCLPPSATANGTCARNCLLGQLGVWSESAVGAQLQDRDFSALGDGRDYLFPARTRSGALFGFTEAQVATTLKLQLGVRIERVETRGTPMTDEATDAGFTPASGSVGLVFDASDALRLGLTSLECGAGAGVDRAVRARRT